MLLVAMVIFTYYTVWALFLVRAYLTLPCSYIRPSCLYP